MKPAVRTYSLRSSDIAGQGSIDLPSLRSFAGISKLLDAIGGIIFHCLCHNIAVHDAQPGFPSLTSHQLARDVRDIVSRGNMADSLSSTPELRWAEQERAYRADRRAAGRQFVKSFAIILCLLVTAVTVSTVLAIILR
jgi:hypothetical protein